MSQEQNLAEILKSRYQHKALTISEIKKEAPRCLLRDGKALARSEISPNSENQDYQHKALTVFQKKISDLALTPGPECVSQEPHLAEIWKSRLPA